MFPPLLLILEGQKKLQLQYNLISTNTEVFQCRLFLGKIQSKPC